MVWRLGAVATSRRGGQARTDRRVMSQYLTICQPFFADFFQGKLGRNSSGISPFTEAEEENSVVFGEKAWPSQRGEIQNDAQLLKLETPSTLLGPQGWLKSGLQNKKQPEQL